MPALIFRRVQQVSIHTLRGCPFCVRALGLLDSKGAPYREIDVSEDRDERVRVSGRSGHKTFPQIYIGDVFIGGYEELRRLDESGRLDPMLA